LPAHEFFRIIASHGARIYSCSVTAGHMHGDLSFANELPQGLYGLD
jgi:hypothetical protein